MGKTSGTQQTNKVAISKDKFSDADFDCLVIDTSRRIGQHSTVDGLRQKTKEKTSGGEIIYADDQLKTEANSVDLKGQLNQLNRLNQPKRPMNAFMVWGQAVRRELHNKFSNVQNAMLSKALGRVWKKLDQAEKEPYIRRANTIKTNHKRDYPNYRYQPRRVQERRSRSNLLMGVNHLDSRPIPGLNNISEKPAISLVNQVCGNSVNSGPGNYELQYYYNGHPKTSGHDEQSYESSDTVFHTIERNVQPEKIDHRPYSIIQQTASYSSANPGNSWHAVQRRNFNSDYQSLSDSNYQDYRTNRSTPIVDEISSYISYQQQFTLCNNVHQSEYDHQPVQYYHTYAAVNSHQQEQQVAEHPIAASLGGDATRDGIYYISMNNHV